MKKFEGVSKTLVGFYIAFLIGVAPRIDMHNRIKVIHSSIQ